VSSGPRTRAAGAALAAALAVVLGACGERKPEMIVAAPASPAPGPAAAPAPPPAPVDAPPAPPGAAGAAGGLPSSADLLAQVEALKGRLARAPKTVEILAALGDLYYEHQRLADALSWYDQAVEAAKPVWSAYLALPAPARAAEPSAELRARCARGPARGHAELAADARALAAKGDRAAAAACYRSALEPAVLAEVHRANAWFLAGDPRRAIAEQEGVLARVPGHPEATYFLALFLADTAGDDVAQLRRARALLDDVARLGLPPHRADDLRGAQEEIARRIAEAGVGTR
jgi:tetratricopeptide (TPR) repeat protein